MFFESRIKMFIKKMEGITDRRGVMESFYKLDLIRNLSNQQKDPSKEFKYALEEKTKINMYLNKLMPSAFKENDLIRQTYKLSPLTTITKPLENIAEELTNSQFKKKKELDGSGCKESRSTTPIMNVISSSLSKHPKIVINGVKDSKFKLSSIHSRSNNFLPGDTEVPYMPEINNNMKNTLGSIPHRLTVLSNENLLKKEMFNPVQMKIKKTQMQLTTYNNNIDAINEPSVISQYQLGSDLFKTKLKPENKVLLNNYAFMNAYSREGNNNQNNLSSILSNNLGNDHISSRKVRRKGQIVRGKGLASSSSFIRIGDIVLLRYNFKTKTGDITNEGILCPEKIISKRIFCLSMNKIEDVGSGRSIFKRSLFRIENPQSYICQYQYETGKKHLKTSKNEGSMPLEEENVHELAKLAYEEKKGNESEFQLNYGNEVAYGQIIQLRNIFTNELLVVDLMNISKEIGCLDLILNPLGGQIAWFKFIPSHKIRNLGECVSYLDDFFMMTTCIETESYIHVNHNDEDKTTGMEVNISSRKSILKLSLFESAEEIRKGKMKNVVKSASAIKIYNQEYEGYITADFNQHSLMLPRLKTDKRMNPADLSFEEENINNNPNNNKNSNHQQQQLEGIDIMNIDDLEMDYNEGIEENLNININVKRASTYTVGIDGQKKDAVFENCNTYWEIQYEKPYEGKLISCGCPIRFRHISSGFYLSFNPESKEIGLSQALDSQTVFYVYSDIQENNIHESPIMNGSQVYFSAKETECYLKVNTNKLINARYSMIITQEDKMEYAKMIFKIELISNNLVKINYNVALTIHHLRNLYDEINNWGIRTLLGDEITKGYVYDYILAVENESKLSEMTSLYLKILKTLKDEAMTNNPESIHFKQFQNFHSDQGFISLLLNYIMLFDSKSISTHSKEEKNNIMNYHLSNNFEAKERIPEKIAVKYTKSAITLSFEIIQLLITDNSKASHSIYSSINLISKLFDFHKLEVIKILILCLQSTNEVKNDQSSFTEFYRSETAAMLNPNNPDNSTFKNLYAQIGFWKSKMAELNETEHNLVEQKLFLQIMQMLCLDSNASGIFANQMEIKVKLYESDLFPLKFGMDDNLRPYIIINTKLSYDDFFQKNPSLSQIRREKNNFKDVPMFYYDNFNEKYEEYIDYICAVLDLYYASCVSRNQINIHIISNSKYGGLTIAHIWQILNDNHIQMSIRVRYIKLFRVMYIDSDPFIRISKFRLKVFIWSSQPKEKEDMISYIYKWFSSPANSEINFGVERDKFDYLRIFIKNFFKKVNDIESIVNMTSMNELTHNKEVFKNILDYINEVFMLTKELIDFGYFNLAEINEILVSFAYFFSIFEKYNPNDQRLSNDDVDSLLSENYSILKEKVKNKNIRNQHWLANLAYECLESEYSEVKAGLFVIFETCINILHIICTIKEDLQIYEFLNLFKTWYYDGSSLTDNTELLRIYNVISNSMKILDFEIEDNEPINPNDSNFSSGEGSKKTLMPLDIYLLGVLFNDYDNEFSGHSLDNKALGLLIKYFNEYENLKKQLTTIEIIVNSEDINIFNSLTTVNCRILELKNLLYRDYVCFQIYQNSEKQGNLNRLHDLTRIIEVELIAKLDLKVMKKLCKIQNMCRHLKIHETLIDLSNFLLSYDKNLPVYKAIFKFLYHFCYRNYHNQLSMKHYFIPFLNRISQYEFICEVLTEVLNLYKETPKSKKYIDIIFDKITKDNEISSEEIDVLRSLTINYKDENIPSNQGMIIQNFLYHSKFIKMNFTEEDKRELDEMLNIIKQKQSNSPTVYKKVIAQVKFIELLSSCSIENTFCILNCRRLVRIDDLMKYLYAQDVPYALKPSYLAFFVNVFYPSIKDTEQNCNIQFAIDVLENLALLELSLFYFYANFFIDRAVEKHARDQIPLTDKLKSSMIEMNDLLIRKIKENETTKEILTINLIDLNILDTSPLFNTKKYLTEQKKNEYIKFLLSDNHNYNLKQEGLLIFIYDIFAYITKNSIEVSFVQRAVIQKVKCKIEELLDFLSVVEEKLGEDDKITEIEYAIQRCISIAPKSKYNKIVRKLAKAKQQNQMILNLPISKGNEDEEQDAKSHNSDVLYSQKVDQNAKKVLKFIQEFLIVNETNVTGIFNLLDTDNDKQIDKFEFKRNLKLLLSNKVTNDEIEDTMNYLDANQDDKITLKELSVKLYQISKATQKKKKYNLTNLQDIKPFLDLETKLDDKSSKISSIFKHFILAFHEIHEKVGRNLEIGDLVKKLNTFLTQDDQGDFMKKFLDCLKSSFDKKKYKIYLLRIMFEVVNSKIIEIDENNKEKYSMVTRIQSQLNNSGVTDFAMSLIDKTNSNDVIEESLNLMILLLKNGNVQVQDTVYAYLSDPSNTFTFLSFVRELLHSSVIHLKNKLNLKEYENAEGKGKQYANFYQELNKYYNKSIDLSQIDLFYTFSTEQIEKKLFLKDEQRYFRIPQKILLFLQLLCENCYEKFQHFLRDQEFNREDKERISSVNIVYEIGNLLISLLNFGNAIYSDKETLKLINQAFLTLADLCLGPCKENQILLGSRRTMFKMINNLLRNDYNFHIKEQTHRKKNKLMCRSIIFLKTLINHDTLKQVGRTLLDEIDIYLLIEKLIDIFEMKIHPNVKSLYSGFICDHYDKFKKIFKELQLTIDKEKKNKTQKKANTCKRTDCEKGYISQTDIKYINTGFDIFIILTSLQDVFPNHPKLVWFKFKIDLPGMQMFNPEDGMNSFLVPFKSQKTKTSARHSNKHNTTLSKDTKERDANNNNNNKSINDSMSKANFDNTNYSQLLLDNKFRRFKWFCCCRFFGKKTKAAIGYDLNYENVPNTEEKAQEKMQKTNKKQEKSENDIRKRFMIKYREYFNDTYIFFAKNISNVEIYYRGEIAKTYFKIPFLFKFLPNETKTSIIWDSQYDNHQARLEALFKQITQVKKDLIHQQNLGSFRAIFGKWHWLNTTSFILSLMANVLLFAFIRNSDEQDCDIGRDDCVFVSLMPHYHYYYSNLPSLLEVTEYFKIALNILAIIFLIVNQYPVINSKLQKRAGELNLKLNEQRIKKYSGSILFFFLYEFLDKISEKNESYLIKIYRTKGVNLLFDGRVLIFLIYLIVSFLSVYITPFFNLIILLDIIRRNKYLLDVFYAMKLNFKQLVLTIVFLIAVVYGYSVLLFFTMRRHFNSVDYMGSSNEEVEINAYCDKIYNCFLSIIHIGITTGKGLGLIGAELYRSSNDYWLKYAIDVSFFFVVLLFIFNIIFSVIIDSFRELRDQLKLKEKTVKEYCFVCGIAKYIFEIKGNGWVSHYKYEHNIFSYLYYVIELEEKEMNDCDGLEKYVKTCIEKENYTFLPLNQALSIKEKNLINQGESNVSIFDEIEASLDV